MERDFRKCLFYQEICWIRTQTHKLYSWKRVLAGVITKQDVCFMEHPRWRETFQEEVGVGKENSGEQASSSLEPHRFPPFLSSMRMGLTKEFKSYKNNCKDRMKKKKKNTNVKSGSGKEECWEPTARAPYHRSKTREFTPGSGPRPFHPRYYVAFSVEWNLLPGLEIRISGFW